MVTEMFCTKEGFEISYHFMLDMFFKVWKML